MATAVVSLSFKQRACHPAMLLCGTCLLRSTSLNLLSPSHHPLLTSLASSTCSAPGQAGRAQGRTQGLTLPSCTGAIANWPALVGSSHQAFCLGRGTRLASPSLPKPDGLSHNLLPTTKAYPPALLPKTCCSPGQAGPRALWQGKPGILWLGPQLRKLSHSHRPTSQGMRKLKSVVFVF